MFAMTSISNCYSSGHYSKTFWWSNSEELPDKDFKQLARRAATNKAAQLYNDYMEPRVRFFKSEKAFVAAYKKQTGNTPNLSNR